MLNVECNHVYKLIVWLEYTQAFLKQDQMQIH